MLPLRDINPTRRFPILTFLLIGINVAVFIYQSSLPQAELQTMFLTDSVVPKNVTADPYTIESVLDIFRSMFFHAGLAHLGGNMLYLYLFGDNIEDRFGRILFLVLYFASGTVAAVAQIMISPDSGIPLVGASGAIAGVLGSYLILYPGVKVQGIIPIGYFATLAEFPAFVVLFMWFGLQLLSGVASLGAETATGGVAFFAHIGGFIAGILITLVFIVLVPQPPAEHRRNMLYDRARQHRW
jgi:membrane associated rhomboid family serine protease